MICKPNGDGINLSLNQTERKKVADAAAILKHARQILGVPELTLEQFSERVGDDGKYREPERA